MTDIEREEGSVEVDQDTHTAELLGVDCKESKAKIKEEQESN